MFHRVKPEAQSAEAANTPTSPEQPAAAQQAASAAPKEAAKNTIAEQPQEGPEMTQDAQQTPEQNPAEEAPQAAQAQEEAPAAAPEKAENLDVPANPYQRAAVPIKPAAVGGMPYGTSPYASHVPHQSSADISDEAEEESRRLTIGQGITMSGEIEACDYLTIEGSVEAALKGAKVLEVAETGTFYGAVEIEEATIAGRFEGDIMVRGLLTIRAGGMITGSIAYGELQVESGAVIDGKITPISALSSRDADNSAKKSSKSVKAKAGKSATRDMHAANSDGELFREQAAAE